MASRRPRTPKKAPAAGAADRLAKYRAMRSADRTAEPFGAEAPAPAGTGAPAPTPAPPPARGPAQPLRFVVQKHAARRLHYDFRLELGNTLRSWAVPQGPSPDPKEKRLAVQVEDHPVEYAQFEGVIPEGNYGAGPVIVWDQGHWEPEEDPEPALAKGKLGFTLHGYKLRGSWALVRISGRRPGDGSGKEWLLIKHKDGWARAGGAPYGEESILSGLTLEQLRAGRGDAAAAVRAALEQAGAPRRAVRAAGLEVMLAETRERPFSSPDWLFELKYDGYRLVGARDRDRVQLCYRRGGDSTAVFPEVARALRALPFEAIVLDGEVVVLDEEGRASFQRLQRRVHLTSVREIERAAVALPATYFAFDLLGFEGYDVRPLPLVERKALLTKLLPAAGPVRFADHVAGAGEAFYAAVQQRGLEGIVAKRADAPYRGGRSPHWLKLRVDRTGDFVVVGLSPPRGARTGFGSLHIAANDAGTLRYAGRVGSGFTEAQLSDVVAELAPLRRATPACEGAVPKGKEHLWVEPRLVCEVRYKEWTDDASLRHPVFLRFRDDKAVVDCTAEGHPLAAAGEPGASGAPAGARGRAPRPAAVPAPAPAPAPEPDRKVRYTNLDKVFWPDEGYTKGDLVDFYRTVAPWLLPYLRDRPVVLTRYPDGIRGKSFYQKDAPGFAPDWIRTARMWSESSQRHIDYFVCDDVESLLYLVNSGTIPLHVWSSRTATIQQPDWCILDLDPKGAPFADVVTLARALHDLCDEIGLPCFVKTSGSTGLHVLVPLGGQCTYEQSRTLGHVIARVIVARHPDIATIARAVGGRRGRVYLDYLQNVHGQLLVSPYSVRPLAGAPVSTPLRWDEVNAKLAIADHTIRTVPQRLARLRADPVLGVLSEKPDLPGALARLAARVTPEEPEKP